MNQLIFERIPTSPIWKAPDQGQFPNSELVLESTSNIVWSEENLNVDEHGVPDDENPLRIKEIDLKFVLYSEGYKTPHGFLLHFDQTSHPTVLDDEGNVISFPFPTATVLTRDYIDVTDAGISITNAEGIFWFTHQFRIDFPNGLNEKNLSNFRIKTS